MCRGSFTRDIVTPVLGVAGVGGVMAIYGAADSVVCASPVIDSWSFFVQTRQMSKTSCSANCHVVNTNVLWCFLHMYSSHMSLFVYCWSCLKVHSTWQTALIMCHVTNVVMDFTVSRLSRFFFLDLLTPPDCSALLLQGNCPPDSLLWSNF